MSARLSAFPEDNIFGTAYNDGRLSRPGSASPDPSMLLMHGTATQQLAMADIYNAFDVTMEMLQTLMQGFEEEMRAGLEHDGDPHLQSRSGSLKMIPSFVTGYPTGYEQGTYLALEISGVDIYVCQVKLKGQGGKLAINQYQYEIPDDLTAGDDFGVLADYVADCVADFQQRVSTSQHAGQHASVMAISLGLAIRQTSLSRGTILALEHGFEFPNVTGIDVVELFQRHFEAKGLNIKIVAIANDSVCTLLAHAYQHPSTRIGIVHSTGTNCAYYERVTNMPKFLAQHQQVDPNTDMIINTEWCNFGSRHLPMTRFDHRVDAESNNQGIHIFEKLTTGVYLGETVRQVLVELLDRGMLSFPCDDSECLLHIPYQFDTSYMYVCEADDDWVTLEDTRVVLEDMCKVGETSLADREIVKKVCQLVGQRAAILLGASIASVVNYMVESGIGLNRTGEGFSIAISGEVYKDYPSFHPRVCEALKALIPNDVAAKLSVGIVKHSRIVGAAIVAMMAEKIDGRDIDIF